MGEHRRNNNEYKRKLIGRKHKERKLNEYIVKGSITEILLNDSNVALIDTEDINLVKEYTWRLNRNGYAVSEYRESTNKSKRIQMHRLINKTPYNYLTDHINHNKLDNRKINLRTCTKSQNAMNISKNKGKTSLKRGVSYQSRDRLWIANICVNGKRLIKHFKTEEEAIEQRNEWEEEYFGDFRPIKEDESNGRA